MTCRASHIFACTLTLWFLTGSLSGCSGQIGADPTEDPIQPSNGSADSSNPESNSANGVNNSKTDDENTNTGLINNNSNFSQNAGANGGNKAAAGADVNNASDEDFLNGNNSAKAPVQDQGNLFGENQGATPQGNQGASKQSPPSDTTADINGAGTEVPPISENIANQEANKNIPIDATSDNEVLAPVNSVTSTPAPNVGQPEPASDPTGRVGEVRYVLRNGSHLHTQPNGSPFKTLEQGDHPLVNEEGEWARTSDGYYIPTETLTPQAVPRFKRPSIWQ